MKIKLSGVKEKRKMSVLDINKMPAFMPKKLTQSFLLGRHRKDGDFPFCI